MGMRWARYTIIFLLKVGIASGLVARSTVTAARRRFPRDLWAVSGGGSSEHASGLPVPAFFVALLAKLCCRRTHRAKSRATSGKLRLIPSLALGTIRLGEQDSPRA